MLYMAADEMEKVDKTPTKVSHFYYVKLYVIFFTCQAPIHPATVICIGNHMIASTIKDLHYEWYLKIVPKLHVKYFIWVFLYGVS